MAIPLEPRPAGDPAAMHVFASRLSDQARELSARADELGGRWAAITFEGPAARRLRDLVERDRRTVLALSDEVAELAARVRRAAFELEAEIAQWEQYRAQWIQQQAAAARRERTAGS